METLSDGEVMAQVRDGDVGQLGVLFERHHGRLYNYCLRLTGNAETSRDLVQEVFFRMLKYRHTYRDDGAFLPWIYRLGLTLETAPEKVERDLMELLPRDEWTFAGHALILHGRRVCVARKPRCSECGLAAWCPRNGVEASA